MVNEENDQAQFEPMMAKAEEAVAGLQAQGHDREIGAATVDAGYNKAGNLEIALDKPYKVYIALTKEYKMRKAVRIGKRCPKGRMPKDLTPQQRMERQLATKVGQETYKRRSSIVEPVNGQLKAKGAGQMLRRGLANVKADWTLICTAHNLTKLWRHTKE